VVAGSDWPINSHPSSGALTKAMQQAGLSDDEQSGIAAGNGVRLSGLSRELGSRDAA
jgi:hypothetical protein